MLNVAVVGNGKANNVHLQDFIRQVNMEGVHIVSESPIAVRTLEVVKAAYKSDERKETVLLKRH